ncbi:MAG: SapC family protein [Alphaproteobacteria bacterium]|nr:SapC family protein [Alphaproteobacteria bacterium]MBU0796422.1 SapC family protein [Alphaproteobacteria bacterium]MBU0886773.1 SapC family protein [Alphaproteobacteria bacterium]MBU1812614.1 SapC family protein [Alphaproteobacteria bacterium]MBU2091931.1 SapC family protein [Alphaproteobacteria bacterium]
MYKSLVPVSAERHAGKFWQPFPNYGFAAGEAVLPLTVTEVMRASSDLAIGFMRQDEIVAPVAICGLMPGQNLYVAPDGRWLGSYVPASLRSYPFALVAGPEGERVVCFDEESGLLSMNSGEPFFDDDHKPVGRFAQVVDFFTQLERDRQATRTYCDLIDRQGLFSDWQMKVDAGQGIQEVTGLLRVDEVALNNLSDEAFLQCRHAGILPLIYAHLLSTNRLSELSRLSQVQAQLAGQQPQTRLEDVFALPGADDLEFNFD